MFTCTGGYWSRFFYKTFVKPFESRHPEIYSLAVMSETCSKDVQQLKLWAATNRHPYKIYRPRERIPNRVFKVDFGYVLNGDDEVGSEDSTRFFKFIGCTDEVVSLYSKFLEDNVADNVNVAPPNSFFNRDTKASIISLVKNDPTEALFDLTSFEPGPGFEFLVNDSFVEQPFTLMNELHNRVYIQGATTDLWEKTSFSHSIHTNPRLDEIGVKLHDNIGYVGRIPPKGKGTIKALYSSQLPPPLYDVQAELFFRVTGVQNRYHVAPVCLKNVADSVMKFCPSDQRVCDLDDIEQDAFVAAYEYTKNDWSFTSKSIEVLDLQQVVSLRNWSTSPGYPYNKTVKDARTAHATFAYHVADYDRNASNTWMPTIYNVFGKKEILKKEKGDDIRTIIAPCLAQQLVSQKLTLNMTNKVGENYKISHTSIGRTRYNGDVNRTGTRIGRFPNIVEYDISKWDRSIKAFLLKVFWLYCWDVTNSDSIDDFYKMANVFESTIYSFMALPNGDLVRKAYGVPSGFTLTSYANSWIHTYLVVLSYLDLYPDRNTTMAERIQHMINNMDFVCYGDDGLMGLSDEASEWYSLDARAAWYNNKFGISLPPEKSKVQSNFDYFVDGFDVTGITFLGDVIGCFNGTLQPIFSVVKSINSIVHAGFDKNYTPHDKVMIAFMHYVSCFFHPRKTSLYLWLGYCLKKVKGSMKFKANFTVFEFELLKITHGKFFSQLDEMYDANTLDRFIIEQYYSDYVVPTSSIDSHVIKGGKNFGVSCAATAAFACVMTTYCADDDFGIKCHEWRMGERSLDEMVLETYVPQQYTDLNEYIDKYIFSKFNIGKCFDFERYVILSEGSDELELESADFLEYTERGVLSDNPANPFIDIGKFGPVSFTKLPQILRINMYTVPHLLKITSVFYANWIGGKQAKYVLYALANFTNFKGTPHYTASVFIGDQWYSVDDNDVTSLKRNGFQTTKWWFSGKQGHVDAPHACVAFYKILQIF
uniref:RNA-dependent RNA polymerase n=1 Tax=Hainan astro-like virus 2 TaxID=2116150 RepID=A0A2P1GNA0_9VIRU|nr:RNA-dependent RNA polymerase [Hainan astro-like virus 2]